MLKKEESFIEKGSGAERFLPKQVWSQDVRAEAVRLFKKGYGFKTASYELKVPAWTVRDWKRKWKAGNFQAKISTRVYRYPQEIKAKAHALRKAGYTFGEIEDKLKVSRSTIYFWLRERNNKLHPRNSQREIEI